MLFETRPEKHHRIGYRHRFPYNWAAPEEETPEHCLLKQEKKEQVWKALNRLNETQRTLIVAHYIHNQTYDYISKKYGIEKAKSDASSNGD